MLYVDINVTIDINDALGRNVNRTTQYSSNALDSLDFVLVVHGEPNVKCQGVISSTT